MKPYLAIIIDSLREALASRVLWVLVIGITLVLLALAPLGYRTDLTTEFLSNRDFYSPQKFAVKLRSQRLRPGPARAIWEAMDQEQQAAINDLAGQDDNLFGKVGAMRRALNGIIVSDQLLYDEKAWQDQRILPEAEELLQRAEGDDAANEAANEDADVLTDAERHRLNRLLIEGVYPEHFRSRPDKTVTIVYAMLDFPRTWLSEGRLQTIIKDLVLPAFTNLLLGVVAVLIALLVTSPIIPEMFSPGSLHLLLSKPLSRSLVFLSRFFGGCFFVLINVAYLLFGLWLILGLRFGIWNYGLLKCIPLFLFLFIVYYSVAALAGAYWKNAIVAVAVAAALWGVCFVLGITKEAMRGSVRANSLRRLVVGEDLLMGVSENDEVAIWSEEDDDWSEVFENGNPLHGPLLISSEDAIVASSGGGRGPRFARRGGQVTITMARAAGSWTRQSVANAPDGTAALMLNAEDKLLVLAPDGVHKFQRDLAPEKGALFGFQLPLPSLAALAWKKVAEPDEQQQVWEQPMDADIQTDSGDLIVYSRGRVTRFAPASDSGQESGMFQRAAQCDLSDQVNPDSGVMIRWYGDRVGVALGDGQLVMLDGETLNVLRRFRPSRLSQPKMLAASPDGSRLAVLMKNGSVLLSRDGGPLDWFPTPHATTIALSNDAMWIGANDRSVTAMDLSTRESTVAAEPPLDNLQRVYRWIIQPLATVLPMPSELGNTSRYLLSGKETTDSGLFQGTLDAPYEEIDPWTPVIRCSLFVLVMLSLGCLYIERQEF